MKNSLRLIAVSVVVCFGLSTGAANAGLFDGQTVNYQYYFSDLTTPYSAAANGDYLVDSSVEVSNVVDGYGTLDFSGDSFVISFAHGSSFSSAPFNGFVVSDIFSTTDSFTSFNLVSNTGILGTPTLSFDADHLYVNWQGLNFGGGDLMFTVNPNTAISPIPEPETHAMLIVGLGLMGYTVRRRRILR
ncbi:PEP-CTERM sorting domain-containing protein [Nitrosomonas sp.]|uniref:PEP-CTERM sorting domain-containing protein n=1 Tax=Nitrosomonas sp. TaxID=42353 RepID=UPI002608FF55|nr:PEP-CTERM sorting domain-containing protein [Nitrosomonas sp.]